MTLMPKKRAALAVLTLVLALPASSAAQDLERDILRARKHFASLVVREEAALVPQLWELARWARARKLYLEVDRIARAVIAIDPDHSPARKALKYLKRTDGWVLSRAYRTPRNFGDGEQLELYAQALVEVTDPFQAKLFRRLERDSRKLAPGTRDAVLRRLLVLDPDDEALRAVLGERKLDGRWVLEETARAAEVSGRIATRAEQALERVRRPGIDAPTKPERGLKLAWKTVRITRGVRVLGTTQRAEVDETARVTQAVAHFFHTVFGHGQSHRRGYTIFLLKDPGQRDILLETMEGIDDPTKDQLRRAAGGWLGKPNRLGEWDPSPARRLDGAARQTLGTLLMDAYGIDGRHGWAWEGLGLYMVYRMVGTRLTYFIDRTGYTANRKTTLWPRLQAPGARWLVEARVLLASERAPGLEFLLGRSVDTMRDEDLLYAYALAAYLLEGRPDDVPRILKRIGAGEHPVRVFEAVTGLSLEDLELRIRRWLDETLPPE
jgi:hypothetical protein